jgi:hypothetical protein
MTKLKLVLNASARASDPVGAGLSQCLSRSGKDPGGGTPEVGAGG